MTRATIWRAAILLCVAISFAVAAGSIGSAGIGAIVGVARRLGIEGFAWYCAYSLAVFVLVGGAWAAAAGAGVERIGLFTWARLVREATADLLPLSQIGGLVIGARVLSGRGFATARVHASVIVDLATEIASQLVFTLFGAAGLVMLLAEPARLQPVTIPLAIGGIVVAVIGATLLGSPAGLRLARRLAARIGPLRFAEAARVADALQRLRRRRGRVATAFALNLSAWVASAAGAWVVLRLMNAPLPLFTVLILESLIFLLRSVAFAIPGGIGVQELGYFVVGPTIGLPVEAAVALALAKRARDLAIGIPTLIVWQLVEVRTLWRSRSSRRTNGNGAETGR